MKAKSSFMMVLLLVILVHGIITVYCFDLTLVVADLTDTDVDSSMSSHCSNGENLAFNKPVVIRYWMKNQDSTLVNLTDGDPVSGYLFNKDPMYASFQVDLGKIYTISRVIVYTGGDEENFKKRSLRGYSVYVSNNKLRWEEVGVIHEIGIINKDLGGHEYATVNFPPTQTRYVRCTILETRIDFPLIGELVICGK